MAGCTPTLRSQTSTTCSTRGARATDLSLAMDAPSVLDVGCGTGTMLHRARAAGHPGRLVGIDPDRAALQVGYGSRYA